LKASVRSAVASDAAALASVTAAISAAGPISPDRHAQGIPALGAAHYADLIEKHAGQVYVAEVHGSVVGYLALQGGTHSAVEGLNPIQLWQLYVVPAFHGTGVAAQLMSAALNHAREHRHDVIWLGVSEQNMRGMAFYRKHGFAARGVHQVGSGEHAHRDVVMSWVPG
jgi:diamine N-acetyltransferase